MYAIRVVSPSDCVQYWNPNKPRLLFNEPFTFEAKDEAEDATADRTLSSVSYGCIVDVVNLEVE